MESATNGIVPQPTVPITVTLKNLGRLLEHDDMVKVAGIDCDGVLRGKIMAKEKFLSSAAKGFGMSSAIFGWDMHDVLYRTETSITSSESGYADFVAIPDLSSYRRIPWEDKVPFFLLKFYVSDKSVLADGRGMLRKICAELRELKLSAKAGG